MALSETYKPFDYHFFTLWKKKEEKMEDMSRLVLIKWFVAALLCGACIIEIHNSLLLKA